MGTRGNCPPPSALFLSHLPPPIFLEKLFFVIKRNNTLYLNTQLKFSNRQTNYAIKTHKYSRLRRVLRHQLLRRCGQYFGKCPPPLRLFPSCVPVQFRFISFHPFFSPFSSSRVSHANFDLGLVTFFLQYFPCLPTVSRNSSLKLKVTTLWKLS